MSTIEHSKNVTLNYSIEDVFPLFTPEGEKLWAPGWDYDDVMGTTELSEDYVFLTRSHDHATKEAIWIVKQYDPASHIVQYYKIEPGDKVGVVTVECTQLEAERTSVCVSYKYIALSEVGEKFITKFNASAYKEFIDEWKKLLTDYFESSD